MATVRQIIICKNDTDADGIIAQRKALPEYENATFVKSTEPDITVHDASADVNKPVRLSKGGKVTVYCELP